MQPQELRTLKILEAVEQEDAPSQRDLARQLNISLGLVNSFIKRLISKGYFKVSTIPRNRVRYILTPKGAAEKTRLTYEFIRYSFEFYKDSRKKMRKLLRTLEEEGVKSIVFYGAGDIAEIAFVSLQETGIQLKAVLDDKKAGKKFLGLEVEEPMRLSAMHYDKILITDLDSGEKILGQLEKCKVSRETIAMIQ